MLSIFRKWSIKLRKRRIKLERSLQQKYRIVEDGKKNAGEGCMNCKVPLTGPFCHICGQKDDDLRRPIWTFFRELLDNIFSADSRLVKSIFLILLVPGGLTRAYSMGRRARFVPPLRLYLSVSIMFFAVLWLFDILLLDIKLTPKNNTPTPPEISDTGDVVIPPIPLENNQKDVETVDGFIEEVVDGLGGKPIKSEEQRQLEKALDGLQIPVEGISDADREKIQEAVENVEDRIEEVVEENRDGVVDIFGEGFPYSVRARMFVPKTDEIYEGLREEDIEKFINNSDNPERIKQVIQGLARALKEPRKFNDLFNEWLPKTLFVMVPLLALILRFFHWGKKRVYIHQLVFSLHFHSFLFLLFSALIIIVPAFGGTYGFGVFWWGSSLYMIIALKVGQNQGWIKSFFKAGLIWVSYVVLLMVGLVAAIFQGLQDL